LVDIAPVGEVAFKNVGFALLVMLPASVSLTNEFSSTNINTEKENDTQRCFVSMKAFFHAMVNRFCQKLK
jgi:hypothetical protein